ncbi:MAG: hypothetical protein AB3N28_00860, partial [Kordiimonas sp.]
MATLNTAVQALVDNLHAKMIANPPELSAEEQLLVSKALSALSDNTTWEQALVAVATEHLNTATDNMDAAVTTATNSIDASVATATSNFAQAQTDMTTALTNATNQVDAAKANLDTKTAEIAIVGETKNTLDRLSPFANLDKLFTAVTDNELINVNQSSSYQRMNNIISIFSSDGTSDIMTVPNSFSSSPNSSVFLSANWFKQTADKDPKFDPVTRADYCAPTSSSTESYLRADYTKKTSYYGMFGLAKLASSTDANDIQTKYLIA